MLARRDILIVPAFKVFALITAGDGAPRLGGMSMDEGVGERTFGNDWLTGRRVLIMRDNCSVGADIFVNIAIGVIGREIGVVIEEDKKNLARASERATIVSVAALFIRKAEPPHISSDPAQHAVRILPFHDDIAPDPVEFYRLRHAAGSGDFLPDHPVSMVIGISDYDIVV